MADFSDLKQTLTVVTGSILLIAAGNCLGDRYELEIDSSSPARGTMRLVFDRAIESDTALFTRNLGEATRLDGPICETSGSTLDSTGSAWIAHAGCSAITWEVHFEAASQATIDVSEQTNLHHESGWWLLTEWGDLLRRSSHARVSEICATTESSRTCQRVPSVDEPPLLMLIGKPQATIVLGESTFRFFAGHLPAGFNVADLYDSYEHQLSYLHSLMTQATENPPPSVVDVLVLGIVRAHGVTGGATGNASFLANLVVNAEKVDATERTRLLWISGHELSHLLGMGTESLWASESLAHYYGFKSLEESDEASILFEKMADNAQDIGLIEAHRRVTQEGEGQYYGLYYSRGAAFWKEVDEAISAASAGKRSLDEFLPLLLNGNFGPNGELPLEFVESITTVVGTDVVEQVCREFL